MLHQPLGVGQEGREVENGARASGSRALQDRLRLANRRLELRDPDLAGARLLADHRPLEVEIGARRHGDGVVLAHDLDDGDAGGRSTDLAHAGAVDVVVGEKSAQAVGEGVVAHRTDHRRRHTQASRGDRLVEALASGKERHRGAGQGFSHGRSARALHDDVHVEAAADDHSAHRCFFTSPGKVWRTSDPARPCWPGRRATQRPRRRHRDSAHRAARSRNA